jgi:Family of unknown function (DUF5343)
MNRQPDNDHQAGEDLWARPDAASEQALRNRSERPPYTARDPSHEGDVTAMAEVTRRSDPRVSISTKNWWDLRRRFRQSVPDKVDVDFLHSALGLSGRRARILISQLRAVGMIDGSGAPSELAIQWLGDAGYPDACMQILRQIYPRALRDACPPPTPDPAEVADWFARNEEVGHGTAVRLATFYCLVAAADPRTRREPTTVAQEAAAAPTALRPEGADGEMDRPPVGATRLDSREPPQPSEAAKTESGFARARTRYIARRWPVVILSMLVGGIAGFVLASSTPDIYLAEAAVIATNTNLAADQLGLVTETAFSTDEVLQPVIDRLGLDATPASVLANGQLDAQSVSGGPALLIFGRATNPQIAADLANAATDSFVAVAEQKGLGTFAPFRTAGPGTLEPHHTGLWVLLGIIVCAGISLLVLATAFFLRDPVVTEERARMDFPADAVFRLRVQNRRSARSTDELHRGSDAFDVWPRAALDLLAETVRERVRSDGRGPCAVIVGGGDGKWAAAAIARKLDPLVQIPGSRSREASDGFAVSSSDPRLSEVLAAHDAIVALVPWGSPRRSLRRVGGELHGLDVKFRALVLIEPSL